MVYAESFELTPTQGSSTKSKTITLSDTDYTHAIVFINSGHTKLSSNGTTTTYDRTAYLVANDSNETILYSATISGKTAKLAVTFSGNIISITATYALANISTYAVAAGSGIILAYK